MRTLFSFEIHESIIYLRDCLMHTVMITLTITVQHIILMGGMKCDEEKIKL